MNKKKKKTKNYIENPYFLHCPICDTKLTKCYEYGDEYSEVVSNFYECRKCHKYSEKFAYGWNTIWIDDYGFKYDKIRQEENIEIINKEIFEMLRKYKKNN